MYKQGELDSIVEQAALEANYQIEVISSYYDHENWCIEILKLN